MGMVQARNNARAVVAGSIDMFSNEYFKASLEGDRYNLKFPSVHVRRAVQYCSLELDRTSCTTRNTHLGWYTL